MKILEYFKGKWQAFRQEMTSSKEDGNLFKVICVWVYKLRSVFLSIPVAFAAVVLAIKNYSELPQMMNLYGPSFGSEGLSIEMIYVDHNLLVFGPLLITAVCILMVLCSKRVSFPWLISVFSLVLPLFFSFVNTFPG